ncbi:MAG: gamma-glutamylcyclotransferase [Deltaproteobacteria bacterium]|nr:gamma-glutamylcyclotransferase [Deltaproteobacteria bacterium]
MTQFLFLYGGGPTPTDLAQACRDLHLPAGSLRSLGRAHLPDLAPAWVRVAGGPIQLAAVPSPAGALPGLLLQVTAATAANLASHADLQWTEHPALSDDGRVVWAWTAQVGPPMATAQPDPQQLRSAQNFLKAWNIDSEPVVLAAADRPVPALCDVFAYGTLRLGEPNAPLLEPATAEPGYMNGKLWSLGAYPVLTPAAEPARVVGEVRHCRDLPERLQKLDELEDFTGYHPQSMYWRVLGRVHTGGGDRLAWLWQMNEVPPGAVAIPSGDWRDRQVP